MPAQGFGLWGSFLPLVEGRNVILLWASHPAVFEIAMSVFDRGVSGVTADYLVSPQEYVSYNFQTRRSQKPFSHDGGVIKTMTNFRISPDVLTRARVLEGLSQLVPVEHSELGAQDPFGYALCDSSVFAF